jgi:hypothetical protein
LVSGFWIRKIQLREHELLYGNIFGERPLVDDSEWDLHVKVVCGCKSSLHRYCCGGVVAAMATQNNGIYKTIILPVVLYGCETWSLTLRE